MSGRVVNVAAVALTAAQLAALAGALDIVEPHPCTLDHDHAGAPDCDGWAPAELDDMRDAGRVIDEAIRTIRRANGPDGLRVELDAYLRVLSDVRPPAVERGVTCACRCRCHQHGVCAAPFDVGTTDVGTDCTNGCRASTHPCDGLPRGEAGR